MDFMKRLKLWQLILIVSIILSSVAPAYAADPMDTWKLVYAGSSSDGVAIRDVAFGNNVYVGVGSPGMLYYSLDGQKWDTRQYSLARTFRGVCYGNNRFVAVGDGQSGVSNDGIVWTFHDLPSKYLDMYDIAYANGYYTAVGEKWIGPNSGDYRGAILVSVDGITWTEVWWGESIRSRKWTQVIVANGEFVVVGGLSSVHNLTANPNDVAKWTRSGIEGLHTGAAYPYNFVSGIAYGNGFYVALTYFNRVMVSKDGYTWEEVVAENELGIKASYDRSLIFSNGVFVLSGVRMPGQGDWQSDDYMILYSTDGRTWLEGAKISNADYPLRLSSIQNRIYGVGQYASIFRTEPLVAPLEPMFLSATAKGSSISVSWRRSPEVTGYKVYRTTAMHASLGGYSQVASLGADQGVYQDSNVQAGTTYYYKVLAYNKYGASPYSDVVSAKALTEIAPILKPGEFTIISPLPTAPSGLSASAMSQTEMILRWEDKSEIEIGYEIERRTTNGTYTLVGILGQNETSYIDTALQVGTTYHYRVRAYTKDKESLWSNEAQATTLPKMNITPPQAIVVPEIIPEEDIVIKFYINQSNYIVNSDTKSMDVSPIILEGRTLLPIRYVAEPLGADVGWDEKEGKVTVSLGAKTVELWLGKNLARVNGVMQLIDETNLRVVPIVVPPGRTMLPVRFIAESLGFSVNWNEFTREVMITRK